MRFFHGTALVSAERIVTGEGLSAATAAGGRIDGEPGFFLATYESEAEFFAARRAPGTVIVVDIEEETVRTLKAAGARLRPIPVSGRSPFFAGAELWVPTDAFDVFNGLRGSGGISVHF